MRVRSIQLTMYRTHILQPFVCVAPARPFRRPVGSIYADLASGSFGQPSWTQTDVVTAMGIGVGA